MFTTDVVQIGKAGQITDNFHSINNHEAHIWRLGQNETFYFNNHIICVCLTMDCAWTMDIAEF